jgi:hypothetical protein
MGVTKAGFDKIGYFDERLERKIDTDYSIRAIRQGLNIGYHHGVGVTHIGVGKTTEDGEQFQKRSTHANEIMGTDQATGFVHSMWEIIADRLDRASKRNVVLNITGADKLSKGEPPPPEESV